MDAIQNLEYYKILLDAIVEGLKTQGLEEAGGSGVCRLLHDDKDTCIKVFLNDYAFPTHIITRISS